MLASHSSSSVPIVVGVLIFVAFIIARVARRGFRASSSALQFSPGMPYTVAARGILLEVSVFGTRTWARGARLEQRAMRVDVEIPGKEPYEIQGQALFPTNLVRDLVPGASVELRVSPGNRSRVYIVGLGSGFSGALPLASPPPPPPA